MSPCRTSRKRRPLTGVSLEPKRRDSPAPESPSKCSRRSPVSAGEEQPHLAVCQQDGFSDLRHYVPQDIINVSFPVSVRGYDRRAVDAYIKRVNRAIAELKVSASPPAAVRHALDQAGEKGDDLLRAAREAAEQITTSAREEAEENADRVKAEAVKVV